MATRLYDHSDYPARPLTLDAAYARAYQQLYDLVDRMCFMHPLDTDYVLACREQVAVRLERALHDLVPELAGIYSLARPLRSE